MYVLCDLMGYAHKFEVYSGQEKTEKLPDEPDLGATGNVVVRLLRGVPRKQNHIIYYDNFYTSLPLVLFLAKSGIHTVGTVQQNRIPNNKLPEKKNFMKKSVPRGSFEERVSVHKKNTQERGEAQKSLLTMGQFRNELAFVLCNRGTTKDAKRGRPSTSVLEEELQSNKRNGSPAPPPLKNIRKDGVEHWPKVGRSLRCKFPKCKGYSTISCNKCGVNLCLNKNNN